MSDLWSTANTWSFSLTKQTSTKLCMWGFGLPSPICVLLTVRFLHVFSAPQFLKKYSSPIETHTSPRVWHFSLSGLGWKLLSVCSHKHDWHVDTKISQDSARSKCSGHIKKTRSCTQLCFQWPLFQCSNYTAIYLKVTCKCRLAWPGRFLIFGCNWIWKALPAIKGTGKLQDLSASSFISLEMCRAPKSTALIDACNTLD